MTHDPKPVQRGITAASIRASSALTAIYVARGGVSHQSGTDRLAVALHVLRQAGARHKKATVEGERGPVTRVTVSKEADERTHHAVLALSDNNIEATVRAAADAPYRKSVDYDFTEDT